MTCDRVRGNLSPYLDGQLPTEQRCLLLRHLENCRHCRVRLEQLQRMSEILSALSSPPAPADLGLRLRVIASHCRAHRHEGFQYWEMRLHALLRAAAVPASAGLMGAVLIFAFMFGSVGRTMAGATAVADVPLPLSSPPRLVQPALLEINARLVVEANIDSFGRVDGYRVLSGPQKPDVIHRLNSALLFSVFQPATVLGQPTPGQVVISYNTVNVQVRG